MTELDDTVVKNGFDSSRDRLNLSRAMTPEIERRIVDNSVSRMVLERLTRDRNMDIRYDINTVCISSHKFVPERGPCFASFYEIVSYVTHKEKLLTAEDILPTLNEASFQIKCHEEASFFAMAEMAASQSSAKTLAKAVNDLVNQGATTIAVGAYQDDSYNYGGIIYRYEDNHKLRNEIESLSKLYPNVTIVPTLSVSENKVYGFKGKVGQLWIQQGLEIIPADEMKPDNSVDKYGYVISEIISTGITKPDLVFKVVLED